MKEQDLELGADDTSLTEDTFRNCSAAWGMTLVAVRRSDFIKTVFLGVVEVKRSGSCKGAVPAFG